MTKIQLSADEMQLVINSHWILTKHRIIDKVYALFGQVAAQMQDQLALMPAPFQQLAMAVPPKIAKGEKYEDMPWVVLDYPRIFSRHNVFAIRSFFWWGNYFSITLHLKGIYLQQLAEILAAAVEDGRLDNFYFSAEEDEFNFNLSGKGYFFSGDTKPVFNPVQPQPFLKLSYKFSFDEWNQMEQLLMEAFKRFITIAGEH